MVLVPNLGGARHTCRAAPAAAELWRAANRGSPDAAVAGGGGWQGSTTAPLHPPSLVSPAQREGRALWHRVHPPPPPGRASLVHHPHTVSIPMIVLDPSVAVAWTLRDAFCPCRLPPACRHRRLSSPLSGDHVHMMASLPDPAVRHTAMRGRPYPRAWRLGDGALRSRAAATSPATRPLPPPPTSRRNASRRPLRLVRRGRRV